jgi:hypothetical protein
MVEVVNIRLKHPFENINISHEISKLCKLISKRSIKSIEIDGDN